MVDWELIRHWKQPQINKDNTRKNRNRVYHNYKVGDNVILNNHTAYKYETQYKGPFMITHCFTNGMVNLQCSAVKINYNIRRIKPYTYDTKIDGFSSKICLKMSAY